MSAEGPQQMETDQGARAPTQQPTLSPSTGPGPPGPSPQVLGAPGPSSTTPAAPAATAPQQLPIRQYLDSTVVPTLMQGMQALVKERPADPVTYLANFLLQHNPHRKPPAP